MTGQKAMIPIGQIAQRILLIRGQRVMLDADLADLYGTTTKRLNEQVKRNRGRFPEDFMFQLTEKKRLRWSQFATTSRNSSSRRFYLMHLPNTGRSWLRVF
jgi:hypothetical protein